MQKSLKTLLSIAGSDPTGGAGVQADIRAASVMGLHPLTAITSVTAQNSKGIKELGIVSPGLLNLQLEVILEDVIPDAIKIGMIGSLDNAKIILDFLKKLPEDIPIVIDPVLIASVDGNRLYERTESDLIPAFKILPTATVVTPNLSELKVLSHYANLEIKNLEDTIELEEYGDNILEACHCNAMIVKGGHASQQDIVTDLLLQRNKISLSSHPKVDCKNLHGTGCTYSTLLAGFLAMGYNLEESFRFTSDKIYEIISHSCGYMLGSSSYGPLNICNYIS